MPLHESGHALACIFLGLEVKSIDLVNGNTNCTIVEGDPYPLTLFAGGSFVSAVLLPFLITKEVRKRPYFSIAILTVGIWQLFHALIETFMYQTYILYNLGNLIIIPFVLFMIAVITSYHFMKWCEECT